MSAKNRSIRFIQELLVWDEVHVETRMRLQPRFYFGVLVGRVVISDHVDVEVFRCLTVNLTQEPKPFHMRVFALGSGDQLPFQVVQCRKQRDRPVPFVVMRLGPDVADPKRQSGLRPFQGLALAFLIAAKQQRLIRRVQVQTDDVPELLLEPRVVGDLESTYEMGLEVVLFPIE